MKFDELDFSRNDLALASMKKLFGSLVSLGVAAAIVLAAPASAHVVVSAQDASPGSFTVVSIRVPNEEDDASTVQVKVQLPVDHPLAFVSVRSKPGWKAKIVRKKLATPIQTEHGDVSDVVGEVTWSGGSIAPGEFDEFQLQVGPLPKGVSSLTFKTIQTYRNAAGKTSETAWIQESVAGQPEPEHPAPVLQLVTSPTTPTHGDASAPTVTQNAGTPVAKHDSDDTDDNDADSDDNAALLVVATAFGVGGLAVGLVALLLVVRSRKEHQAR